LGAVLIFVFFLATRVYAQLIKSKVVRPRFYLDRQLEPPNPGSLQFYKRIGFTEAGQRGDGKAYRVVLLSRTLKQM